MRSYELTVILDSTLEKAALEKLLDKLRKIITDNDGKVAKMEEWGKRALTYAIKKQKEGVYYFLNLELNPAKTRPMENKIKIESSLLRHLLVRID